MDDERLIYASELLETLYEKQKYESDYGLREGLQFAIDEIHKLLCKQAPSSWILTKDRLPDKPGRYLAYAERTIYCNHNEIDDEEYRTNVLYFDGKEWTDLESICYDVIRWMPIPEYRTS